MKNLVAALVLAVGGVAVAQEATKTHEDKKPLVKEAHEVSTQKPGESAAEAREDKAKDEGADATEVGPAVAKPFEKAWDKVTGKDSEETATGGAGEAGTTAQTEADEAAAKTKKRAAKADAKAEKAAAKAEKAKADATATGGAGEAGTSADEAADKMEKAADKADKAADKMEKAADEAAQDAQKP